MVKIASSFLAADFLHLADDVRFANEYADLLHIDVMDGSFVPNLALGFPDVRAISSIAGKPLDVHLMIVHPEKYALKFAEIPGVGMVSFHLEASDNPAGLLTELKKKNVKAGLAINPDCPPARLVPYLENCDFILIMSVFAGFGGQAFIEETYSRMDFFRAEIKRRGLDIEMEVDGGVNPSNSALLREHGADILVAGTSIFKAADRVAAVSSLRQ